MSEPVIPERWHVEQPREFPHEATKFPWRIVNDKGDSIALVGDHLAALMASAPELEFKLKAAEAKVAELEAQRDEARGIAIECNEQMVELEARLSEHPIHGPVTISVTDDTRKLGEALERIARREALLKGILEDLKERGTGYREYARGYRASENWSLADDAAGKASGIFLAVRMIRKALEEDAE